MSNVVFRDWRIVFRGHKVIEYLLENGCSPNISAGNTYHWLVNTLRFTD